MNTKRSIAVGSDTPQGPGWWVASDGKWYPPQAAAYNQVNVPKKSHKFKWFVIGLVVLVVIIIISASSSGNKTSTQTGPAPAPATVPAPGTPAPAPSVSQIGQTVKDGNFAFVVQSFVCGDPASTAVNPDGYGETVPPGAQECVATIAVTADKGQAQTFFASDQYGFDASGRKYSADDMGAAYILSLIHISEPTRQ